MIALGLPVVREIHGGGIEARASNDVGAGALLAVA
jgi:hypothetical protein